MTTTYVGYRVVELLEAYGVRYVFGVPGGQTLGLYQGLLDRSNGPQAIRHILLRDERSCVFAADSLARVSQTTGVCDATVGPGATNLVSGLAEAYASSIPLVSIVSDIDRSWSHLRRRSVASQALDGVQMMFSPVSKWFGRVDTPEAVSDFVDTAFMMANSGRPGPVVLEIPEDVLLAPLETPVPSRSRRHSWPWFRCAPDRNQISDAIELLRTARRPVIIAGAGALSSGSGELVERLAKALSAPVATTMSGKGTISEQHDYAAGVIGWMGVPSANDVVRRADVVLLIGSKAGQGSLLSSDLLSPEAAVIHVDVDPANFGLSGRVVPLWSDAKLAMQELLHSLPPGSENSEWKPGEAATSRREWRTGALEGGSGKDGLRPQAIVDLLNREVGNEATLVCDASLASGWGATYFDVDGHRRYLAPRGLAGLGWAAPAAIGAALADASRRVICLAGDGAWGYSLGEVESMVRLELPVLNVVLNNGILAWSKHGQVKRMDGRHLSTDFLQVDFAAAAIGLGARGRKIQDMSEMIAAISEWRSEPCPTVLDVVTDEDELESYPQVDLIRPVRDDGEWTANDSLQVFMRDGRLNESVR